MNEGRVIVKVILSQSWDGCNMKGSARKREEGRLYIPKKAPRLSAVGLREAPSFIYGVYLASHCTGRVVVLMILCQFMILLCEFVVFTYLSVHFERLFLSKVDIHW